MSSTHTHIRTSGTLVRFECQMGIQLLAERANDGWFVELIVLEELKGLSVEGDVDLADGVMQGRFDVALCHTCLQPGVEQAEAITALNLIECSED